MKMYLVRNLSSEDRDALMAAGVQVDLFDASRKAYVFPQTQLNQALNGLNSMIKKTKRTRYDNIEELVLQKGQNVQPANIFITSHAALAHPDARTEDPARENYIQLVLERFEAMTEGANQRINDFVSRLPRAIVNLTTVTRREFVQSDIPDSEDLKASFESLCQIDKVSRVVLRGCHILVYTDVLKATNPATGRVHELGKFLITINLKGKNEVVRWMNLSRRVEAFEPNMSSPRIFAKGTAYTTDMQEIFATLVASFEIAPVVEMAIEFVETCEAGNPFDRAITCWPIAQRAA